MDCNATGIARRHTVIKQVGRCFMNAPPKYVTDIIVIIEAHIFKG